jgi:release factor glutamine methyltransferase
MTSETWTPLKLVCWATDYFAGKGVDTPRLDAEILLAHALNCQRIALYTHFEKPIVPDELALFKTLVQRRARREPVAYITGKKAFWEKEFLVGPEVLIPRPETECPVQCALDLLPKDGPPKKVLELGAGSGALVLSVACERPVHEYTATDLSQKALDMARKNAANLGLDRILFAHGDWFGALAPGQLFDLILANPPYIESKMLACLEPEIREYEPVTALDGGKNGLDDLARIIDAAPDYLAPGGALLLEIGSDQGQAVEGLAKKKSARWKDCTILPDFAGRDRVALLC